MLLLLPSPPVPKRALSLPSPPVPKRALSMPVPSRMSGVWPLPVSGVFLPPISAKQVPLRLNSTYSSSLPPVPFLGSDVLLPLKVGYVINEVRNVHEI